MSESTRRFVVKSEEERYVLGEVYIPNTQDTDDEFMDEFAIRRIAHKFLQSGKTDRIDRLHDRTVSGNKIAESFIVRGDNDPDGFKKGSWVLGAYISNDEDWDKVKKGEFNGWSWYGDATIVKVPAEVDHPVQMVGVTEPWPFGKDDTHPQHHHEMEIIFDDFGKVVPGVTKPAHDGHLHVVTKTTATLQANGHSHRIVID